MNFELTKEQKAIYKAAWDFASKEFTKDVALECEVEHRYPRELLRKACELGLVGIEIPEEYGGQGYGVTEMVLVREALTRKDASLGLAFAAAGFGTQAIRRFGTEDQKMKYLPKFTGGEWLFGSALTEPNHGSDITDLETTATRDGDSYVINGVKTFVTNGLQAGLILVLCKTDPNSKPPYKGFSAIAVEMDREGIDAVDVGQKMGMHAVTTAEIAFKNVRVPVSNVIGTENNGFYQILEMLAETRAGVSSVALGGAACSFDRALAYVKQREQFGRPLSAFQITQHKIAEMATKIETARLLVYKAAWTADQKKPDPMLSSMAKYYAARVAVEVCDEAVQLMGGYGYLLENEVERFYRDMRIMEIFEGAREIQKNAIARFVLGLD